jgi:hypothetical protein
MPRGIHDDILTIPDALNDPQVMQQELAEDFSGDVLELDQWTILDWTLLLTRVDAAMPGNGVLTQWTLLDPLAAIEAINAALAP